MESYTVSIQLVTDDPRVKIIRVYRHSRVEYLRLEFTSLEEARKLLTMAVAALGSQDPAEEQEPDPQWTAKPSKPKPSEASSRTRSPNTRPSSPATPATREADA